MIGTQTLRRAIFILILLTVGAVGLVLLWGCNNTPVSVPGVSAEADSPSLAQLPYPPGYGDDLAETTGTVDDIDYADARLRVGDLWFRAGTDTEIDIDRCESGCTFADIVRGDAVKVKHERTAGDNGDYGAREIEVENEEEPVEADQTETVGTVAAVDGSSFEVAGVWFWTDAATVLEMDECAQTPVATGDAVKVEHSTIDTAGFGYYAFKVELSRACEEEVEEDDTDSVAAIAR
jgi:hypothetical protein